MIVDPLAIISLGGLGIIFAAGLALAHRTLKREGDPQTEEVEEMLPGVDCGACGYSSCEAMAEAIVSGEASPAGCTVAENESIEEIADFMGISLGREETGKVARLLCRGDDEQAKSRGEYVGLSSCRASELAAGGPKLCTYGCLGLGDCVEACDFNALYMNDKNLPVVVDENCVACGDCVEACPRDLFELHSRDHELFVWCKSHADAKTAQEACEVACIACGLCVNLCDGVNMEEDLAVVDHEETDSCDPGVEKCPTGAIAYKNNSGEN